MNGINARGLVVLLASWPSNATAAPEVPHWPTADSTIPIELRVNYMDTPLGIDDLSPTFSWKLAAADGARGGEASCTLAVKVEGALDAVVSAPSSSTQFVPIPTGLALTSDTSYMYTVTCGGASATAGFSTGLLEASDWAGADWIAGTEKAAVLMRKSFTVAGEVTRARIFIAVPGYGQVSLNGEDVDGDAGTRTWSQYDIRTLYHTYDVTEHVKTGDNIFGLHIGEGWYGMWGYGNPTAKAVLRYTAGGKTTTVSTDGSWTAGASPVTMDSEYNGVTYDARNETKGWDTVACASCSSWPAVTTGAASAPKIMEATLSSASFAKVDVMHHFTAKWMREPAPGVYVFDFMQNIAGWVKVRITGAAGTTVILRHAEALMHPPYGPRDGNIYVGNLRSAKATDTFILKGDPEGEEFQPVFTQHGFRYVEMTITGTDDPAPPSLDMLEAINIRSGMEQTGAAAFSDLMLNQVQHNILWGQADNLMMIPTDCDNRDERLGWTGDSALSSDEASLNYDMGAFYHNWARMLDDTSPNGAIDCTVPGHAGSGKAPATGSCDASWTSVYPSVVHATMKYYGDLEIVKDNWVGLNRFMDNELNRAKTQGIKNMFSNFGDWVPPPGSNGIEVPGGAEPKTPAELSAGFSYVNDLRNMADMARAMGNAADHTKYTTAYTKAASDWHTAWYDTNTSSYDNGHQTAHVLALYIDAPPADLKPKVLSILVHNILAHENHTTCGIIGWRFQLDVLSTNGYGDLAYALITQQTYPGFGFEILNADEPATTIWELWDGPYEGPGMNSRNHMSVRNSPSFSAFLCLSLRFHGFPCISFADETSHVKHVRRAGRVGVPLRGRPDAGPRLDRLRARLDRAAAEAPRAGGARRQLFKRVHDLSAAALGVGIEDDDARHFQRGMEPPCSASRGRTCTLHRGCWGGAVAHARLSGRRQD